MGRRRPSQPSSTSAATSNKNSTPASNTTKQPPPVPKSQRIRELWTAFEAWLTTPKSTLLSERNTQLSQLDLNWARTPSMVRPPKDEHERSKEMLRNQLDSEISTMAKQEWEQRLASAGLSDDDWGQMSPQEVTKVQQAFSCPLPPPSVEDETHSGLPSPISTTSSSSFTFVNPTDALSASAIENFISTQQQQHDIWQNHPGSSSASSSLRNSPAQTPDQLPLVTTTHRYIGPVLSSPDESELSELDEEESSFATYKHQIRVLKIRQFHSEAAEADIALLYSLQLASSKRERALLIEEHEARMMELRKLKEEERKAMVEEERRRRREQLMINLRRPPEVPFATKPKRKAVHLETDSDMAEFSLLSPPPTSFGNPRLGHRMGDDTEIGSGSATEREFANSTPVAGAAATKSAWSTTPKRGAPADKGKAPVEEPSPAATKKVKLMNTTPNPVTSMSTNKTKLSQVISSPAIGKDLDEDGGTTPTVANSKARIAGTTARMTTTTTTASTSMATSAKRPISPVTSKTTPSANGKTSPVAMKGGRRPSVSTASSSTSTVTPSTATRTNKVPDSGTNAKGGVWGTVPTPTATAGDRSKGTIKPDNKTPSGKTSPPTSLAPSTNASFSSSANPISFNDKGGVWGTVPTPTMLGDSSKWNLQVQPQPLQSAGTSSSSGSSSLSPSLDTKAAWTSAMPSSSSTAPSSSSSMVPWNPPSSVSTSTSTTRPPTSSSSMDLLSPAGPGKVTPSVSSSSASSQSAGQHERWFPTVTKVPSANGEDGKGKSTTASVSAGGQTSMASASSSSASASSAGAMAAAKRFTKATTNGSAIASSTKNPSASTLSKPTFTAALGSSFSSSASAAASAANQSSSMAKGVKTSPPPAAKTTTTTPTANANTPKSTATATNTQPSTPSLSTSTSSTSSSSPPSPPSHNSKPLSVTIEQVPEPAVSGDQDRWLPPDSAAILELKEPKKDEIPKKATQGDEPDSFGTIRATKKVETKVGLQEVFTPPVNKSGSSEKQKKNVDAGDDIDWLENHLKVMGVGSSQKAVGVKVN